MNVYQVGDRVRVTATFVNASAVAADPTTITCNVKVRYVGTLRTYTYALAQLTKSGTGVYYLDVDVDVEGIWDYRFAGTGAVVAAAEGAFNVPDSQFF